ncbi:MAG: antitoxin family protein [Armatimonadota bacterium]|nr:antitoxin family protein [Armatimonadota bacterium]
MTQTIEAVYEQGVLKPLQPIDLMEGQRVALSVEPLAATPEETAAQLREWQKVYEGLSEQEIAEVETIALDRSNFFGKRDEE